MPRYIGKDGIPVLVLPLTEEEQAEEMRKWREYINTPHIQALRKLAQLLDEHEPRGDREGG